MDYNAILQRIKEEVALHYGEGKVASLLLYPQTRLGN